MLVGLDDSNVFHCNIMHVNQEMAHRYVFSDGYFSFFYSSSPEMYIESTKKTFASYISLLPCCMKNVFIRNAGLRNTFLLNGVG